MGRIFSVYGSKGGVGKSYTAVNVAASLSAETKQSVLMLDFSMPISSNLGDYLGVDQIRSIAKLIAVGDSVEPQILQTYPVKWKKDIYLLKLISNENELTIFQKNSNDHLIQLLLKLSSQFDFTVIDLGMTWSLIVEDVLNISDRIIMPFASDGLSMLNIARDLQLMQQFNFSHNILCPVLNMLAMGATINQEFAEQRLRRPMIGVIPFNNDFTNHLLSNTILPIDSPDHEISRAFRRLVIQLLQQNSGKKLSNSSASFNKDEDEEVFDTERKRRLKNVIHAKLLDILDLKNLDVALDNDPEKFAELQITVKNKTIEILDKQTSIKSRTLRGRIVQEILQEALGLGLLEDLLADPDVSEIMVVKWDQIYVEKSGKLELVKDKFGSEQQLIGILERIVAPLGRRIDISSPMVDARLKDGSRVNAMIPPLAVGGANLTIRKFGTDSVGVDDLIEYGTINQQVAEFLQAAVKCRLNIIVSGGTGSGKTTLLNILSSFIPEDERIITIEDSAELQLRQPHVITLESRPANIENKGEVSIRELVKNSLRMRPDRIVVGECRAGEALDMLQAMNTGHDGSLTTLHANSTREALSRLETLVLFAGIELPVKAIREQIVGAVDILIQLTRLKDGSRKIVQVSEVTGLDGDQIQISDVYLFKKESVAENGEIFGNFISTGYAPNCLEKFEEQGVYIPKEIFWKTT